MSLPTSRDITLSAGSSQVPSALLNNLQDAVVGNKHGTLTLIVPGSAFVRSNSGGANTYSVASLISNGADAPDMLAPIVLPVGKRITSVRFFVKDGAAGPTKWTVRMLKATLYDAVVSGIGGIVISAGTGVDQTLTLGSAGLPHVVLGAGVRYVLSAIMSTGIASSVIYGAEIDLDAL